MDKYGFQYISDEIKDKFKAEKGDKYVWKNAPPLSTDSDTVKGSRYFKDDSTFVHDFLEFREYGEFLFQCRKCHAHFFLKECEDCQSTSFLYGRARPNTFNCRDCRKEFSSWTCPKCGMQNPNQSTLFLLKKEGCFIATSVYGSPSSAEVILLRNFRNNVLLNTHLGNLIVRIYYFCSPIIADFINDKEGLKNFLKVIIFKPIIKLIRSKFAVHI